MTNISKIALEIIKRAQQDSPAAEGQPTAPVGKEDYETEVPYFKLPTEIKQILTRVKLRQVHFKADAITYKDVGADRIYTLFFKNNVTMNTLAKSQLRLLANYQGYYGIYVKMKQTGIQFKLPNEKLKQQEQGK